HGALANRRARVGRPRRELDPGPERSELDVQPLRELALFRPDPGHRRSGVARNHWLESRARAGGRPWTKRHTLDTPASHTRANFSGTLEEPRVGGGQGWVPPLAPAPRGPSMPQARLSSRGSWLRVRPRSS